VHNNIAKHGGDPKRVFLLGHSAGAHLVALVATAAKFLKAHDLVPKSALAGVMAIDTASYDLTTTRSLAVRKMISDAFGEDAKTLHDASPLQHARQNPDDCPPFVIAAVKQRPEAVSESKALSAVLPKCTLVLVDYPGNGQLAAHGLIAKELADFDKDLTRQLVKFVQETPAAGK
ncbi:MAG: carboxylesterase family protein, partial [Schlesneria sp.]